jgi:hypothetical protein
MAVQHAVPACRCCLLGLSTTLAVLLPPWGYGVPDAIHLERQPTLRRRWPYNRDSCGISDRARGGHRPVSSSWHKDAQHVDAISAPEGQADAASLAAAVRLAREGCPVFITSGVGCWKRYFGSPIVDPAVPPAADLTVSCQTRQPVGRTARLRCVHRLQWLAG